MKRLLPLPALLLVGMCATAQPYLTCPNAQRAVIYAQTVVDRVCPMGREPFRH